MKSNQLLMFPLTIDYQGSKIRIKAVKCTYSGNQKLYKVALPSFWCNAPVCWISSNDRQWGIVLGILPDKNLEKKLLNAISDLEKIHIIYPKIGNAELQSA